jgi:hypothetical protein
MCECQGAWGKGESIILGAIKFGSGRKLNKIDAFNKYIIFLAGLYI